MVTFSQVQAGILFVAFEKALFLSTLGGIRCPFENVFFMRRSAGEFASQFMLTRFLRNDSGATAIEYGLIAGLIGLVIITAVTTLGTNLSSKYNQVSANLN